MSSSLSLLFHIPKCKIGVAFIMILYIEIWYLLILGQSESIITNFYLIMLSYLKTTNYGIIHYPILKIWIECYYFPLKKLIRNNLIKKSFYKILYNNLLFLFCFIFILIHSLSKCGIPQNIHKIANSLVFLIALKIKNKLTKKNSYIPENRAIWKYLTFL